jgi:hypothetical protein
MQSNDLPTLSGCGQHQTTSTRRRRIGVWYEGNAETYVNDEVTCILGFLIEGAHQRGDLRFEIVAPHGTQEFIKHHLQNIAATEFSDWIAHTTPKPRFRRGVISDDKQFIEVRAPAQFLATLPKSVLIPTLAPLALATFIFISIRDIAYRNSSETNWQSRRKMLREAISDPHKWLVRVARRLSFVGLKGTTDLSRQVEAAIKVNEDEKPDPHLRGVPTAIAYMPSALLACLTSSIALTILPVVSVRGLFRGTTTRQDWGHRLRMVQSSIQSPHEWLYRIARALERLATPRAVNLARRIREGVGIYLQQRTQRDICSSKTDELHQMASFANNSVDVEGWLVLSPKYTGSTWLIKPRAVALPPSMYTHTGCRIRCNSAPSEKTRVPDLNEILETFDTAITFEGAPTHIKAQTKAPSHPRLTSVPIANTDLATYLPMLRAHGRNGSDATRRHAGDMLRAFAARIGNRYLAEYPFEAARYLVYVTTGTNNQDIEIATSAIGKLIYQHRVEIKFITTTTLFNTDASRQIGAPTDRFQWPLDLLSLPTLPRDIHAALFHCAQLSVHPANIERNATAEPSLEALSVGTPSIYAETLSVADFVRKQPSFASYVYDPDDPTQLAQLIADMLLHRGDALACQAPIAEMIRDYSWDCAAEQCARVAIGKQSLYNKPPTSLA